MQTVVVTDEANEALEKYVKEHELSPTKKAVVSAAVKRYVDDD